MIKYLSSITYLNYFIGFTALVIFFILILNTISGKPPYGDEGKFLENFLYFKEYGFYQTNSFGNSTVYNLSGWVVNQIVTNELLSLRLVAGIFGLFSFFSIIYFQRKYFKMPSLYSLLSIYSALSVLTISALTIKAYNDIIVVFFTVVLFIAYYSWKENQTHIKLMLAGAIIAFLLSTREMVILFFPSIFLIYLFAGQQLNYNWIRISKMFGIIFFGFIIVLSVLNYPSLIENKKVSFLHKKSPYEEKNVSWVQNRYLIAIETDRIGGEKAQELVTFDYTHQYLLKNGENSLPKTSFECLTFDIKRTIREFFIDFFKEFKHFTRANGLAFIMNLIIMIYLIFNKKLRLNDLKNAPIEIFSLLYVMIMSFIIIHFIENRWFVNIFLLLSISFIYRLYKYREKFKNKNIYDFIVINGQISSLVLINAVYVYVIWFSE